MRSESDTQRETEKKIRYGSVDFLGIVDLLVNLWKASGWPRGPTLANPGSLDAVVILKAVA